MSRLVKFLIFVAVLLFIMFAFLVYTVFALNAELEQTQKNLVDTSNMYRKANQELGYWQEMKPLIQDKLQELRQSQQKDPSLSL